MNAKTKPTERPILFNDEMVRAVMDGSKTQTRRPVKPQPEHGAMACHWNDTGWAGRDSSHPTRYGCRCDREPLRSPFGQPGDLLYVRECWGEGVCECDTGDYAMCGCRPEYLGPPGCPDGGLSAVYYRASGHNVYKWRPSIHMPKWAARTWLRVKRVWVERVQGISEDDAWAEGVDAMDGAFDELALCFRAKAMGEPATDSRVWFAELWDSIYAAKGLGWVDNPWVWCCEFEMVDHGAIWKGGR